MRRGIIVLSLAAGFASPVHAGPGDPRLIQGVLEWPAKLTVEPFVVIRTDDGRWYYSEVKSAKRLESGPLIAGGRVAVLGTESAKPHEITAIALGSGDAAALALALMPRVSAPAAATTPAAPLAVESPSAPKAAATEPSPTRTPAGASTPAAASTLSTPAAVSTPVAVSTPAALSTPAAVSTPTATSTPTTAPAPVATPAPTSAAPATPDKDKASKPPTSGATAPVPANPQLTEPSAPTAPMQDKATSAKGADAEPASEPPRWAELQGTVNVIAGNWIVVRSDSGQLTLVDLSTVRGGASSVRPGAPISVYGTPGEQKFQAMGILQSDNRPPAKPATVPPRR